MKKLKLLSLLALPAVVLPIAFSVTSCSAYSALNVGYKYIDDNSIGKKFQSLDRPNVSIDNLLWGDESFNKGNYVLFITHSLAEKSTKFLLNSGSFTDKTIADVEIESGIDISLPTALEDTSSLPETTYKYLVLTEIDTWETYCGSASTQEQTSQPCSPFEKYTEQDEKLNDKDKKDSYIRNDSQAKAYRKLMNTLHSLFGVDTTSAGTFFALQWVKGFPVKDTLKTSEPWSTNQDFTKWLCDNDERGQSKNWK